MAATGGQKPASKRYQKKIARFAFAWRPLSIFKILIVFMCFAQRPVCFSYVTHSVVFVHQLFQTITHHKKTNDLVGFVCFSLHSVGFGSLFLHMLKVFRTCLISIFFWCWLTLIASSLGFIGFVWRFIYIYIYIYIYFIFCWNSSGIVWVWFYWFAIVIV